MNHGHAARTSPFFNGLLDVFLERWRPGPAFAYAQLPHNLDDPYIASRTFEDGSGEGPVNRTQYEVGLKHQTVNESNVRRFEFFQERQEVWAAGLRDYLLSKDVPRWKLDPFLNAFATDWVDGKKRRQDSPMMLAIKASIREHDAVAYRSNSARFVINQVDDKVESLFTPLEMAQIFQANEGLCDAYLADYVDLLGASGPESVGWLPVRRGARMPEVPPFRTELHYLSSYSLALGPVEQFAQTYQKSQGATGVPSIFTAPLAAVQHRIVAFAPFVANMDLGQLELVVAPPVTETALIDHGDHGGIREFSFGFPSQEAFPTWP